MAFVQKQATTAASALSEERIYARISWRIVPLVMIAYIFAFLDRINVGYVKLQMQESLGFSDAVYGLGAGLFFLTYLLFEVPSNALLEKIGARVTFLRIMVLWGLTSAATMFVTEPWQFYTLRLLLGIFEAGFFPGVILYLSWWYPSHRRGRVTGLFMFGIPVTGILGGPLSGEIMRVMDGAAGMEGWQWVFLLEGLPVVAMGVILFMLLPDRPAQAKWLSPAEQRVVEQVLRADAAQSEGQVPGGRSGLMASLMDPRVYLLAFIYFAMCCGAYTLTFWLPTMIRGLGVQDVASIGWISAVPYVFGALGLLIFSWSSDYFLERKWHVAITLLLGGVMLYLTTLAGGSFYISMAALSGAAFFIFAQPLFWAIPPTYLSRHAAASGIAVISSLGILGGFVSPIIIGHLRSWTGEAETGLIVMAAVIFAGGLATLMLPKAATRVG